VNFARVLKEVLWCLVTEGSISYRRIKLTFGLDDDGLEELRSELIGIKRLAADLDGKRLVLASEGRLARPEGAKSLNHNDFCKINRLSVIPANAGTQGPQGSNGCPGPPLSRGRR